MDCKWLEVMLVWMSKYKAEEEKNNHYSVEETKGNKFQIEYCVRYRPVWMPEWILERWWWNDRWEWTPNGIFNDWIV